MPGCWLGIDLENIDIHFKLMSSFFNNELEFNVCIYCMNIISVEFFSTEFVSMCDKNIFDLLCTLKLHVKT